MEGSNGDSGLKTTFDQSLKLAKKKASELEVFFYLETNVFKISTCSEMRTRGIYYSAKLMERRYPDMP